MNLPWRFAAGWWFALAASVLALWLGGASPAQALNSQRFLCDGEPLMAIAHNGAVDAPGIPNEAAGTVPGAFMVLRWRDLTLQLPRTNNAGAPSYSDGKWWWSLEDPEHPRFLLQRGELTTFRCQPDRLAVD